jgi:hypothetical protein
VLVELCSLAVVESPAWGSLTSPTEGCRPPPSSGTAALIEPVEPSGDPDPSGGRSVGPAARGGEPISGSGSTCTIPASVNSGLRGASRPGTNPVLNAALPRSIGASVPGSCRPGGRSPPKAAFPPSIGAPGPAESRVALASVDHSTPGTAPAASVPVVPDDPATPPGSPACTGLPASGDAPTAVGPSPSEESPALEDSVGPAALWGPMEPWSRASGRRPSASARGSASEPRPPRSGASMAESPGAREGGSTPATGS